jgi:hypothetical protein
LKIESSFCSSVLSLLSVPAIAEGNCGRKRYVTLFYTRVYEQFAKQRKQTRASDKNQAHWCTDWRRQQLDIQLRGVRNENFEFGTPCFRSAKMLRTRSLQAVFAMRPAAALAAKRYGIVRSTTPPFGSQPLMPPFAVGCACELRAVTANAN